jgi:superfamily II DNA or RNA helicase
MTKFRNYELPGQLPVLSWNPRVRALYSQMIGRGTRIHPLKEYLLIPDFLWMPEKHSLCHPAHLLAETDEVADIMVKKSEAKAGGGEEADRVKEA